MPKKDNSTLSLKVSLRRNLLREIDAPIILETHGGYGAIGARCYADILDGVVFEKNENKAEHLAAQRPTWAVYQADCVNAIAGGAGSHLPINVVDCDPYGEPWPVLDAFFGSDRPWPIRLGIAVNDGLRQKLKLSGGGGVRSLQRVVDRHGAGNIYRNYLAICREMLEEKAGQRNYTLTRWAGYYCGYMDSMTHYAAIFERTP